MKKIIILNLCAMLFFAGCDGQEVPKELSDRFRTCDTQSVLLTIIKSEKLAPYFPKATFKKYYSESNHTLDESQALKEIVSHYIKVKDTGKVLATIDSWCKTNEMMSKMGELNPDYPAEAILYYTEETKPLVLKYLISPQQSWASLSTYQLYELNIDFLNYTDKLTPEQKQELFSKLKATADRFSEK